MALLRIIGGLLALAAIGSASAANRPAGYVTLCNEGKTCTVPANTQVAFGRSDQFFYKVLGGSFICSEATFGGRIGGGVNECSVSKGTSSSSSSSSTSSTSSSSSSSSSSSTSSSGGGLSCTTAPPTGYTQCAVAGQRCEFTGTRGVAARTSYRVSDGTGSSSYSTLTVQKVATDGVQCDAANFSGGIITGLGSQCGRCYVQNSSSSSSSSSSGGGSACVSTGTVTVRASIVIRAGATFDGGCRTYVADVQIYDGSPQQDWPTFRMENGATLRNAIISGGFDGVSALGNARLENVTWAATGSAVEVAGSGALNIADLRATGGQHLIHMRAAGTVNVSQCEAGFMHHVFRQTPGTTFRTHVTLNQCNLHDIAYGVFASDAQLSTASLTNSRVSNVSRLCIGYPSGGCTSSNIVTY